MTFDKGFPADSVLNYPFPWLLSAIDSLNVYLKIPAH